MRINIQPRDRLLSNNHNKVRFFDLTHSGHIFTFKIVLSCASYGSDYRVQIHLCNLELNFMKHKNSCFIVTCLSVQITRDLTGRAPVCLSFPVEASETIFLCWLLGDYNCPHIAQFYTMSIVSELFPLIRQKVCSII